jgi:hypothetical protein
MNYLPGNTQLMQDILTAQYRTMMFNGIPLPSFEDVGFRTHSQNEEDGIIHYIFSLIGTTNKKAVEICAGTCVQSNTANLVVNRGWDSLMVDGDANNIHTGKQFFFECGDTLQYEPTLVREWITRENVNSVIKQNGYAGDIDFFSLDMDGVDYWVWDAIDCITPRVVVVEFAGFFGPYKSVTVPYDPDFKKDESDFCGASLAAFVKLGKKKGYRLVGCNRYCFNAFFIKYYEGAKWLPEIDPIVCFDRKRPGRIEKMHRVEHLGWQDV